MMAANIAVVIDASKAANTRVAGELSPAEHLTAFAESLRRPVFHQSDSRLWISSWPALEPAIQPTEKKSWMAGSSPAMRERKAYWLLDRCHPRLHVGDQLHPVPPAFAGQDPDWQIGARQGLVPLHCRGLGAGIALRPHGIGDHLNGFGVLLGAGTGRQAGDQSQKPRNPDERPGNHGRPVHSTETAGQLSN